eukprot:2141847-Rhodomonas_salina.2
MAQPRPLALSASHPAVRPFRSQRLLTPSGSTFSLVASPLRAQRRPSEGGGAVARWRGGCARIIIISQGLPCSPPTAGSLTPASSTALRQLPQRLLRASSSSPPAPLPAPLPPSPFPPSLPLPPHFPPLSHTALFCASAAAALCTLHLTFLCSGSSPPPQATVLVRVNSAVHLT